MEDANNDHLMVLKIWLVHPNIPSPAALAAAANGPGPAPSPNPPRVEYRATLRRHSGVVNCARFSPNGELLATTGDGESFREIVRL